MKIHVVAIRMTLFIRLFLGYEVEIEKSFPRVTVLDHEALPSDAK